MTLITWKTGWVRSTERVHKIIKNYFFFFFLRRKTFRQDYNESVSLMMLVWKVANWFVYCRCINMMYRKYGIFMTVS